MFLHTLATYATHRRFLAEEKKGDDTVTSYSSNAKLGATVAYLERPREIRHPVPDAELRKFGNFKVRINFVAPFYH